MQTQADMGIGPVSCENCSVFNKGEGGPEAPGALHVEGVHLLLAALWFWRAYLYLESSN